MVLVHQERQRVNGLLGEGVAVLCRTKSVHLVNNQEATKGTLDQLRSHDSRRSQVLSHHIIPESKRNFCAARHASGLAEGPERAKQGSLAHTRWAEQDHVVKPAPTLHVASGQQAAQQACDQHFEQLLLGLLQTNQVFDSPCTWNHRQQLADLRDLWIQGIAA